MKYFSIINTFLMIGFCLALSAGCKREDRLDQMDGQAPAPGPVTDVKAISTAGGALLKYRLPKDENLAYVKAVYEIQPGIFREAKSSYYADTLSLVGYGDTLSHKVAIYSVGRNEKESTPVLINIKPSMPPVLTVFKDLTIAPTFGGVNIKVKNFTQANLSIELFVDSTGKGTWAKLNTFYTKSREQSFNYRGMKSVEKKFGVLVRDRWNNKSDTLKKSMTPIFEELIPKNTFSVLRLPTDMNTPADPTYSLENIYDGKTLWDGIWASANSATIPQWFTLDLGKTVLLSRFKAYQLPVTHFYFASALKRFEIWGSNNPNPNGSFDNSWQLMGTFSSIKPSGLPLGQTNSDDYNYAVINGEDFDFPPGVPAVRYLRLKALESYSSAGQITISELTFWGQKQ